METKKMNLFTALNDGMRTALATDESAVRSVVHASGDDGMTYSSTRPDSVW